MRVLHIGCRCQSAKQSEPKVRWQHQTKDMRWYAPKTLQVTFLSTPIHDQIVPANSLSVPCGAGYETTRAAFYVGMSKIVSSLWEWYCFHEYNLIWSNHQKRLHVRECLNIGCPYLSKQFNLCYSCSFSEALI